MAVEILSPLSLNYSSFSIWNVPRYLVMTEKEHNPDGLHFQWPETIEKVNMVHFTELSMNENKSIQQIQYLLWGIQVTRDTWEKWWNVLIIPRGKLKKVLCDFLKLIS
jgi:hypothetical protein